MLVEQLETPIWITAGSCNNSACVEVARNRDGVLVRDSKDPQGPKLEFSHAEWQAFVEGVRSGDFDRLTD